MVAIAHHDARARESGFDPLPAVAYPVQQAEPAPGPPIPAEFRIGPDTVLLCLREAERTHLTTGKRDAPQRGAPVGGRRLVEHKQCHIATSGVVARVPPRSRDDGDMRRSTPLWGADGAVDPHLLVLVPDKVRAGEHVPLVEQHPSAALEPDHPDPPRMLHMEMPAHACHGTTPVHDAE